ncbi:MAG: hypothetical protein OET44_10475 [Gammaproteobacteria bacterium]|nr:hypothetical protein [Gammaproteobacteria bacterium]
MADTLLFGIQTNGIKHRQADPMPDIDTRFRMVKEAGVFDYGLRGPACCRRGKTHGAACRRHENPLA